MDFELSPADRALQQEAVDFARRELDRASALAADAGAYPRELVRRAGRAGLVAVHLPPDLGGRGRGLLGSVLVVEALCRQEPGLGMAVSLCSLGSHLLLRHGSPAQQRSLLPAVAAGEAISAVAFSEPEHGSDITDVATRAVRLWLTSPPDPLSDAAERGRSDVVRPSPAGRTAGDEGCYSLTGVKTLVSNGEVADAVVVLAKTDPAAELPRRGLSLLLLDLRAGRPPGLLVRGLGVKMGLRMMSTAELVLQDVRVPASSLVGEAGRGFYHTLAFLNDSRVEVAGQALGGAAAALDRALAGVGRQAGQATRHALAEVATQVEAARLLTYRAAWVRDRRGADATLSAMAKLYAARVAVEAADTAVQLLGPEGYLAAGDVERIYRDLRVTEIYEGTREVQKNTIAGALLASTRAQ